MENRCQLLYWNELVELKVACEYIRRYRDHLASWTDRFAAIRAVVSLSALATWAVVKAHPMVWGGIIALSQVTEAIQTAIPFAARLRGTNGLSATLDTLFIDCQLEWEDVYAAKLDEGEIIRRRHKLMTLRHHEELKNLPHGLPVKRHLLRLAQEDAKIYFRATFLTGDVHDAE